MTELMQSGLELMFLGMGIVYLFLIMLVFAINLMSAFVLRYFPDKTPKIPDLASSGVDKNTVAAIAAAIHQYRNKFQ